MGSNHGNDAQFGYRTAVICSDGSDMWVGVVILHLAQV